MKICVLCRTDRRGQNDPHAFYLCQRRQPIVAILSRWAEPPHHYFEVRVQDGRRFVLCHDTATGAWELAAAHPKRRQRRLLAHWQLGALFSAMLERARFHRRPPRA